MGRRYTKEEYLNLFKKLKEKNINVQTGIFGANMLVNIQNDGPVTILLEKENKK